MKDRICVLLAIGCLLLFACCATQQKKEDRAYRFMRENPAKLAELCADQYPPKDSISPGKVTHTRDTFILPGLEVPCRDLLGNPKESVTCPGNEIITDTVTKTDTLFRENTARVAALTLKLAAEHDLRIKTEQQLQDKTEDAKKYMAFAIVEGFLLAVCAWLIFKHKFI